MKLTKSQLKEMIREELKLKESFDLKKLEDAIKMFQKKIKKQGRVTNARDEEHLEKLIKVYKEMGGKKIKEGKLDEVGINVSSKPFAAWREHSDYIRKLNSDSLWAAKSFPNKKKEAKQIQKLTQELYKLIEIIKGQAIDL